MPESKIMDLNQIIAKGGIFANQTLLILSVSDPKTSRDNRTYRILKVSDGHCNADLFYWKELVDGSLKRGDFIMLDQLEAIKDKFLSSHSPLAIVPRSQIAKNSAMLSYSFEYVNDIAMIIKSLEQSTPFELPYWKQAFFSEIVSENFLEAISTAPAAKGIHHAMKGGLLYHTNQMLQMYLALKDVPQFKDLDYVLMVAAILLHDYAKKDEYICLDSGEISHTRTGHTLGHIFNGAMAADSLLRNSSEDIARRTNCYPEYEVFREKLLHCILAHHGELEWGSPVKPTIKEAMTLHYLDQLSAKLESFDKSQDGEFVKGFGNTIHKF